MKTETILTLKEVAKSLNISEATATRWIKAGKLTGFFRIGRKWLIRQSDLDKFINLKVDEETNKQ